MDSTASVTFLRGAHGLRRGLREETPRLNWRERSYEPLHERGDSRLLLEIRRGRGNPVVLVRLRSPGGRRFERHQRQLAWDGLGSGRGGPEARAFGGSGHQPGVVVGRGVKRAERECTSERQVQPWVNHVRPSLGTCRSHRVRLLRQVVSELTASDILRTQGRYGGLGTNSRWASVLHPHTALPERRTRISLFFGSLLFTIWMVSSCSL